MSLLKTLKFITNHPLNREHKLKSILRFAKWQVGSRLVPGAVVYEWVGGSKFLVQRGDTGLTGNIYTGLHEFPDMSYLLHVLRSDDLFVDIGANVGSYTLLACSAIGAKGVAFEPVPATFERLMENIRINHLEETVTCINKGLGAESGTLSFTSDSDTMNHALAPGESAFNPIAVEVTTLNAALKGATPALIKIDVEGFETPVLEGAEEVLSQDSLHSVIMELNGSGDRYGYDETRIVEMMFDLGFRTYSYDPFARALINLDGKNHDKDNTLFIRDELTVLDRLKDSPNISVNGGLF
ncbi:MAG: FkbM family methyltransferase [Planctomycetota bacterium]|jgi:FkbM family methyltransferase